MSHLYAPRDDKRVIHVKLNVRM